MVGYFSKVFCQRTYRWRLFCRTIDSSIKRHSLTNDLLSLNQLTSFVLNIWLCHFALEWKGYSIWPLTSNRVDNTRCYQAVLMSEICTTRFTMEIHFVTLHRHFQQKIHKTCYALNDEQYNVQMGLPLSNLLRHLTLFFSTCT